MTQTGPNDALSQNFMMLGLLVTLENANKQTRFMFYKYRYELCDNVNTKNINIIHVCVCELWIKLFRSVTTFLILKDEKTTG